ncbi:H-type lectin domain-containing protein [Salipiger bermudensis]|uniref:H-type lectin domain-containing protein n=1 Tax=Salipiger bermudensis TaxID=344736 RepID=UPI002EA797B0|nr:H-type lectin domain-containing protein [Pseudomonadota bacterium]
MQKLMSHAVGIDQGEAVLFQDFQDGGSMWTGDGHRERRQRIRFSEKFRKRPVVHCSLTLWDVDSTANVRADVQADRIGDDGFDIVFRTWGDSRIARARVGWMAIGEVGAPGDWDV